MPVASSLSTALPAACFSNIQLALSVLSCSAPSSLWPGEQAGARPGVGEQAGRQAELT